MALLPFSSGNFLSKAGGVITGTLGVKGSSGTLTISSSTDGGDYNIFSANGTQTLAIYGSSSNTLNVNVLDGNLTIAAGTLGTSGAYVSSSYITRVNVNGTAYLDGGTGGQITSSGVLAPSATNSINLGTSSLRWGTVWAGTLNVSNGTAISLAEASNIVLGTTTGTKIGTAGGGSGQKLGFFNATPVVQPLLATGAGHTVDDVITTLQTLGLVRQS